MIKYVVIALLLLPCLTFAESKCRVIEYPDHDEVVCGEDVETAPEPSAQENTPLRPDPTADQTEADQTDEDNPTPSKAPPESARSGTEGVSTPSTTQTTSQPSQPASNQSTIIDRHVDGQGRQQPLPTAAQPASPRTDGDTPAAPETSIKATGSGTDVTPPSTTPTPSQPASNQGTIIHRQGRQQHQQSLEDAKAARRQLILERQQQQTTPSTAVPPAPASTAPN